MIYDIIKKQSGIKAALLFKWIIKCYKEVEYMMDMASSFEL